MGSEDHILFSIEDGVGVVTLNRPDRLNAINWDLGRDLVKLFEGLRTNDEVRVIVLTGAGRAFRGIGPRALGGAVLLAQGADPQRHRRRVADRGRPPRPQGRAPAEELNELARGGIVDGRETP